MESEKTMKTGIVPMPTSRDYLLGGHAVMLVGYDDSTKRFTMMNSWGTKVGKEGYFEIPYEYILDKNLCQELWCIQNTI
jgi:C1A family cysteine protease